MSAMPQSFQGAAANDTEFYPENVIFRIIGDNDTQNEDLVYRGFRVTFVFNELL